MSGGRTFPAVVTENFSVLQKRNDKSNRYELKCNHCSTVIVNRDNNHVRHISDARKCPNAPSDNRQRALIYLAGRNVNNDIVMSAPAVQIEARIEGLDNRGIEDRNGASESVASASATTPVVSKKRKTRETLAGLVDFPLTDHQKQRADVKLFRFIVHMNLPFSLSENWYFRDFLRDMRPLYTSPSRYVISHSILDSEAARVRIEELDRIKKSKMLTYMIDGWEDLLKRSIYGSVAGGVGKYPTVLSLEDMTGNRATAEGILAATERAMREMDLLDGKNFIAITTDNPTVMQAFRKKFQQKYFWVLSFACFLHQLNTLIGEICAYPPMKKIITQATRTVTFFNSSHYWGGQVKEEAKSCKITRGLKKNCESRFYAISLLCNSVLENREPISRICIRPDAQKKTNGLSPVAGDVVTIILHTQDFWRKLQQLLKFVKPLVDAIGNVEARDANLADCMLELLRCSKALSQIPTDHDDDTAFALHARAVFNRRFLTMDTDQHSLALFLHPLCRKLAVSTIAKARPFEKMVKTALDMAKMWRWSPAKAQALVANLQQYHQVKGPFVGGHRNSLEWWENLPISADRYPLKALAITLLSVVPHAGEVERLFSSLGGVQTARRCGLSLQTFETLGKLRSNYCYHLYEKNRAAGKPLHRRHAHMHTQAETGVNVELVEELKDGFTWQPPFSTRSEDDRIADPEDITVEEIGKAFDELDAQLRAEKESSGLAMGLTVEDGNEILEGKIYDLKELESVDKGIAPKDATEDLNIIGDEENFGWDVDAMMLSQGVV